jgi:hypothetical protein
LLLFYLLKLRKQVETAKNGGERDEAAGAMKTLLTELEQSPKRSEQNGLL